MVPLVPAKAGTQIAKFGASIPGFPLARELADETARRRYRCATKIDFGIIPWMPLVPSTTWVT